VLDLDEALDRFHLTAPEYLGGLANHGPMAVEALFELGHRALTQGFVDVYAPRLRPLSPGRPLRPDDEAYALGDPARFADWLATLELEIARESYPRVIEQRTAQWIDGVFAGGTHGLIRTAHAARALGQADTPARRRELAHGLAYWAARHQVLPGQIGARRIAGRTPAAVLRDAPLLPVTLRKAGSFSEAARALDSFEPFARCIETLDASLDPEPGLHELCVAAAELFMRHPRHKIEYVHVLTAPSALRLLSPYLKAATRARALACVTRAAAALHAISAMPGAATSTDPQVSDSERELADSRDELRYRAACSLEEHQIKYVEACLREDAVQPHALFRRAAARMIATAEHRSE